MKVLALNGSPRGENSSSYHMLKPLLQGMAAAGADPGVLHIHHLHLKPCLGCFNCWTKTPGECVQRDGMAEGLRLYREADFLIFATPLYFSLMSGQMKIFIDRLLPLSERRMVESSRDPATSAHPNRYDDKQRKMLLLSPCGFPEYQHFDPLIYSFKYMATRNNWDYVGEILRSGAEPLTQEELQPFFTPYYELLRQAGEQLVHNGCISVDLQQALREDLFPGGREYFYEMSEVYWETRLTASEAPESKYERKERSEMQTNKDDKKAVLLRDALQKMPEFFKPEAAGDFNGDVQLVLSGEEPGQYYFTIAQGKCTFQEGLSAQPSLTMYVASEDWKAIGSGKLSGPEAFMTGRLKAEGDFSLMMKWSDFFAN